MNYYYLNRQQTLGKIIMNYYYLKPADVIEDGDMWIDERDSLGWWKCNSSKGMLMSDFEILYGSKILIRRPIKQTKLGNIL